MPTLFTRVSDGESKAITEYANACGLSVSDLIKNVLITKICMLWNYHPDDAYFINMYSVEPESKIGTNGELAEFVNKFRRFVGIRPLEIGDF